MCSFCTEKQWSVYSKCKSAADKKTKRKWSAFTSNFVNFRGIAVDATAVPGPSSGTEEGGLCVNALSVGSFPSSQFHLDALCHFY